MLNGRLYRVAFIPFLVALFFAAFSLQSEPAPFGSQLAPNAFEGTRAAGELRYLAHTFAHRRPGSAGDDALASYFARTVSSLGRAAAGGFTVRTVTASGQTIEGERRLRTVIADRPGSTGEAPIVIVAHRDAAGRGAEAELSGTAALLELGRVFAARETRRTIILVSTSGGSGGNVGAAALPRQLGVEPDALLVLGDVGGKTSVRPYVQAGSAGPQTASLRLQRTVAAAVEHQVGPAGRPSTADQLAHLVFPFIAGEQGVLNFAGLPAVQLQVSGETGPAADEPVSAERLNAFGRAALEAIDSLDGAGEVGEGQRSELILTPQVVPGWALALLLYTLLLPPAVAILDGVARARRRGLAIGHALGWTLSCAVPFLACAAFVLLLTALGVLGPTPAGAILPRAIPLGGSAAAALAAAALVLVLAWLGWAALVRRIGLTRLPDEETGGLAVCVVLLAATVASIFVAPYTLVLSLLALHLWLLLADAELRPPRFAGALLVLGGLAPLAAIVLYYALHYGYDPVQVAWSAMNLIASGQVTPAGAVLWCLGFGAAAGAALVVAAPREAYGAPPEERQITTRGPLGYAGPGSLGGTESALRR